MEMIDSDIYGLQVTEHFPSDVKDFFRGQPWHRALSRIPQLLLNLIKQKTPISLPAVRQAFIIRGLINFYFNSNIFFVPTKFACLLVFRNR